MSRVENEAEIGSEGQRMRKTRNVEKLYVAVARITDEDGALIREFRG